MQQLHRDCQESRHSHRCTDITRKLQRWFLETGQHPGELKDAVCSPAGTTIEAVNVLEKKGMRSAVIEAVTAAAKKNHQLGKKKEK